MHEVPGVARCDSRSDQDEGDVGQVGRCPVAVGEEESLLALALAVVGGQQHDQPPLPRGGLRGGQQSPHRVVHEADLRGVARWVAANVRPGGRIYADFCAQTRDTAAGTFLSKHVWPGPARYVRLDRWLRALEGAGLRIVSVHDDTESYGRTVADWADRLDLAAPYLTQRFGPESVRTFRLLLRGSQYFFESGRARAHRVVAEC